MTNPKIKLNPEIVSSVKPFVDKYNWKGINDPTKIDVWKRLRKIIHQYS